ncbi:M56 family metallopeptidase [Lacipirellula sp.]|uniref:M56 family metallopeptidase n=1 Tax=Lacipirellula sp. TaxID=2691419 RepID=UPI003D14571D
MTDQLNDLSAAWALLMWNIAWQSALLAAAVATLCWLLRRESPGLRYALWLALSLKLLALPLWSVNIPAPEWFNSPVHMEPALAQTQPTGLVASATSEPVAPLAVPITPQELKTKPRTQTPHVSFWHSLSRLTLATWLLLGWAVVVLVAVGRIGWQFRSLRRLLATTTAAGEVERIVVEQCAARLELAKLPSIRIIAGDGSPMVCGLLRPVLILPTALVEQIGAPALRQIILHELAHLKRRDLLTIWSVQAMRTVYWFNPIVHWIAYRAGLERELACDRLAMLNSGANATTYARTLIDAASGRSQPFVLNAAATARLTG